MERLQNSMHACLGTDLTKQFDFPFMCLSHFNPILCIEEKGNVRFPPSKKIVHNEGTTCGHSQHIDLEIHCLALGNKSVDETKHTGSSLVPT